MLPTIFSIAAKSLRSRKYSVGLTIFSIAISITLLLLVETIRVQAKDNFVNTLSGTDLIVGSRSGSIQLLLYSIFHIGNPTNNVSWESYKKISKHPRIRWSVPISLGDSHKGFRVIGTHEDIFKFYKYSKSRKITFMDGGPFEDIFDCVLGSKVATKLGYKLGDEITLSHGMGNVSLYEHKNLQFTVSGILKPTGTPIDESILVSIKGIEAVHIGWESGVATETGPSKSELDSNDPRLEPKTITAFLLGLQSKHDIFNIQSAINKYKSEPLLAILPGVTLLELWRIVGVIEKVLLVIAVFVIFSSLLGMLAILLSTLNERRREIAVFRSVGASPATIFRLLMLESLFLLVISVLLGLAFYYLSIILLNPLLQQLFGIIIELSAPSGLQWLLLGGIILAGLLFTLIPAFQTYKNSLQDGLSLRS